MTSMLTSRASRRTYAVLALTLEPLRILHGVFLASVGPVDRSKAPVLLDLVWGRTSVLVSVQQYYSSVLRGSASRLQLVYAACGELDTAGFLLLRRSVLAAAGGAYRRHNSYLDKAFKYHGIVDPRRDLLEREHLAREFLKKDKCCQRPGLWRQLHARLMDEEGFGAYSESQKLDCLMLRWATPFWHMQWLLKVSVGDIEKCHAKTKRRAHMQNNFALLAAKFLNRELQLRSDERERLREHQKEKHARQAPVADQGPQPCSEAVVPYENEPGEKQKLAKTSKPVVKKKPLDLFRGDYLADKRAEAYHAGIRMDNVVSVPMWREVKDAFDALPESELLRYQARSEASGVVAKHHRKGRVGKSSSPHDAMAMLALNRHGQDSSTSAVAPSTAIVPAAPAAAGPFSHLPLYENIDEAIAAGIHSAPDQGLIVAAESQGLGEGTLTPAWMPTCARWPLSKNLVTEFLAKKKPKTELFKDHQGSRTVKRGAEEYSTQVEKLVLTSSVPQHKKLPKKVQYQRSCGAMCQTKKATLDAIPLQNALKKA